MKNLNNIIVAVLVLSIAANVFLYFNSPNSILSRTHNIDKKITQDEFTWVGINQNDFTDDWSTDSDYELWWTDKNNNARLAESFPMNFASSVEWEANEKKGVNARYYIGGPEGGDYTDVVYDHMGVEKLRIEQSTFKKSAFKFKEGESLNYRTVRSWVEETCSAVRSFENDAIQEVILKGVKMRTSAGEKEFALAEPEKVECGSHGWDPADPTIEILNFDDKNIVFALANGKKGTISVDLQEVEFE